MSSLSISIPFQEEVRFAIRFGKAKSTSIKVELSQDMRVKVYSVAKVLSPCREAFAGQILLELG